MSWIKFLFLLLQLAGYVAQQAGRRDIEKVVLGELVKSHDTRVQRAAAARLAVLSGLQPEQPDDPNRRD